MRRYLASALILSSFSMFALVGCEDKASDVKVEKISTPEGNMEKKTTTEVKSSGDMPAPVVDAPKDGAMAPAPK